LKLDIEYTDQDIKDLILKDLANKFDGEIDPKLLDIKVKSKQNYRSEWESAAFKAAYHKDF
jgi:hypothetical protein